MSGQTGGEQTWIFCLLLFSLSLGGAQAGVSVGAAAGGAAHVLLGGAGGGGRYREWNEKGKEREGRWKEAVGVGCTGLHDDGKT